MSEPSTVEEKLERALGQVTLYRTQMRKTLESPNGKLLVAIKQASVMLDELRVTKLPPQQYYELYNTCFDALSQLQEYLVEDHKNHHLADVYEIVQYTAMLLPRLYLMITVGTAFIATHDAPRQEVLKDMLEMSRGIQCPLRGLFLRYYLGQRTGAYLVTNTKRELEFSIQYTLTNFIEMNKLWVRYQHDGLSKDYNQRTDERKQLRTIVGSSILRLSQLDNLDLAFFSKHVLPALLDQVIQCRDKLAQEYLLDIIVQVFPAEYHLETLNTFLASLRHLVPETSIPLILEGSIGRITEYAKDVEAERIEAHKAQLEKLAKMNEIDQDFKNLNLQDEKRQRSPPKNEQPKDQEDQSAEHKEDTNTDEKVSGDKKEDQDENSNKETSDKDGGSNKDENTNKETSNKDEDSNKETSDKETSDKETSNKETSNKETNSSALNDSKEDDSKVDAEKASPDADSKQVAEESQKPETETARSGSSDSSNQPEKENKKTENQAAEDADTPKPSVFISVVKDYCNIIYAQKVSFDERAKLVRYLIALAEAGNVDVSLHDLFTYIAQGHITGSNEMEKLILSLLDSKHYAMTDTLALLRDFPNILLQQSKETRHKVAEHVINNFLSKQQTRNISVSDDLELAKQVLELMAVMVSSGGFDTAKMKSFISLLKTDQIESTLNLLALTHAKMRKSGPHIVNRTASILVMAALDLLRDSPSSAEVARILKYCAQVCHDLASVGNAPLAAFHIYLTCGLAADGVGAEDAAYEMFVQALSIYEESITDSNQQLITLMICMQALQQCSVFTSENYEPLAQRCLQYGQKLMKKPDQCRSLLHAAHLYWDNNYADARKVEEILGRALRSADSVMDIGNSIELFLDVLDANLYFLGNDASTVTVHSVNNIIKLIKDNLETAEKDGLSGDSQNEKHFSELLGRWRRTQHFVKTQEEAFVRFEGLEL